MYTDICNFIEGRGQLQYSGSAEQATRTTTVAVAAVLWEMARIDGIFDRREFQEIIYSLDRTLDLMDGEAAGLLEIARVLDAKPDRLNSLVESLLSAYSKDQRTVIFSMACRVAESDGIVHQSEERFRAALGAKLGVLPIVSGK